MLDVTINALHHIQHWQEMPIFCARAWEPFYKPLP